jgi:hypothetical protein
MAFRLFLARAEAAAVSAMASGSQPRARRLHLDSLRRGQREVIEQVASSREAINQSLTLLLRLGGKIEDERNPFASERDPF